MIGGGANARESDWRFFEKAQAVSELMPPRLGGQPANYLAFIKLASIRIWLRANESTA
jgi:transposase